MMEVKELEKWLVFWGKHLPGKYNSWEAVAVELRNADELSETEKSRLQEIGALWDEAGVPLMRPGGLGMEVIVTRHDGLIAWLAERGITGEVISHVENTSQIEGRVVYGALPLHLAALTKEVVVVDMPRLPAELRGKDLTPETMDEAGATLTRYRVERL